MSNARITYAELKRRLDRLASSLLPNDRLAGDYPDNEKDRIHAYVVLAHAELEVYLEKLVLFAADQAKRKSSATVCQPIMSRLIFYKSAQAKDKLETATLESINGAFSFFEKVVERNNGIKSTNILQLFLPLGVNHSDLDPILLANLDAFGIMRGQIAHTAARLEQGASPSSEKSRVINIIQDLSHLDQKVRQLI
jgi:hypothetical protein